MKRINVSRNAAKWLGCGVLALGAAACASDKTPAREPVAMGEMEQPGPQAPSGHTDSETTIRISEEFRQQCQLPSDPGDVPRFDFAESTLRPRGANILDDVSKCLSTGPLKGRVVTIIGRTDPRGSVEYNHELSADRASAARDYLVQHGVQASNVRILPRGEQAAVGTNEATWALDRRVDFELGDRTAAGNENAAAGNLNASPDPLMQGMRMQVESANKNADRDAASYSNTAEGAHETGASKSSNGGKGTASGSASGSASGTVGVGAGK